MNVDFGTLNIAPEANEEIVWSGKANDFPTIDQDNKPSLIRRWIILAVVAIVIIVLYIIYTTINTYISFTVIVPIVILAIAAYFIFKPFLDASAIKKFNYVVTNRRVITINGDGTQKDMRLEDIDAVRIVTKKNGNADISFGEGAIKKNVARIRATSIVPVEDIVDDKLAVTGIAFYNVSGYEKIKDALAPGTKVHTANL